MMITKHAFPGLKSLAGLFTLVCLAPCARAQFSSSIGLPGDASIEASAGVQLGPAIARGEGVSLAVWEDNRSSQIDSVFGGLVFGSPGAGNFDVFGVFVDDLGKPLTDEPIVICAETWEQGAVDVAWNGEDYLVVFESTQLGGTYYSKCIRAVRVTKAGVVLDTPSILIADVALEDERYPAVTGTPGGWVVAWTAPDGVLRSVHVAGNGSVGTPVTIAPNAFLQSPTHASMTSVGGTVLVAYEVSPANGIRGRFLNAQGAPTSAIFDIGGVGARRPAVATNGTDFYVAWTGGGVKGTPISATGTVVIPGGALLANVAFSNNSDAGVAWNGSAWTVAFDASPEIRRVTVSAGGAVTQPQLAVHSSVVNVDHIAVAPAAGGATVLWTDRASIAAPAFGGDPDDVLGLRVDAAGTFSPSVPVTVSAPAQVYASMAGDPVAGFLVTALSLTSGKSRILAWHVDGAGKPTTTAPFVVHTGDRALGPPEVAFDGAHFLVTWQRRQSGSPTGPPTLVESRRVLGDGTLLEAVQVLMEGTSPVVAALNGTFLVSAVYHHPSLQSNAVVRARRINGATGSLLDAAPILVNSGGNRVEVVAMADRWLLAWNSLEAAFVLPNGTPLPSFYAAQTSSVGGNGTLHSLSANAAGTEATLAFEFDSNIPPNASVRMRRFALNGTSPDPLDGLVVNDAPQAQIRPTVATLNDQYLVLWTDHREMASIEPGLGDVYASRVALDGSVLDPQGIGLHVDPLAEGAPRVVTSGPGRALIVVSDSSTAGFASHRLALSQYASAAASSWSWTGAAYAGAFPVPPILQGYGLLTAGTPYSISLSGAAPAEFSYLFVGLNDISVPLLGGTLIPSPDIVSTPIFTGGLGGWELTGTFPAGVPSGVDVYLQAWVVGTNGIAHTQGLRATTP